MWPILFSAVINNFLNCIFALIYFKLVRTNKLIPFNLMLVQLKLVLFLVFYCLWKHCRNLHNKISFDFRKSSGRFGNSWSFCCRFTTLPSVMIWLLFVQLKQRVVCVMFYQVFVTAHKLVYFDFTFKLRTCDSLITTYDFLGFSLIKNFWSPNAILRSKSWNWTQQIISFWYSHMV